MGFKRSALKKQNVFVIMGGVWYNLRKEQSQVDGHTPAELARSGV